jgi:hypothetical protein
MEQHSNSIAKEKFKNIFQACIKHMKPKVNATESADDVSSLNTIFLKRRASLMKRVSIILGRAVKEGDNFSSGKGSNATKEIAVLTDTEQTNKGIGVGEEKGAGEGNNNNSRDEGRGAKGVLVGVDTDSTEEGLVGDISLQSAVSVPISKDTTADVSEGHIPSWSPTFRKHCIEEKVIDTELDYLEDSGRKNSPNWRLLQKSQ